MPIMECQKDGKPGFKWGSGGNCITYGPGTGRTREEAREIVASQAASIHAQKDVNYIAKSSDKTLRYTLGVVYEPLKQDTQGDFAKAEVIREAAWDYVKKLQGKSDIEKIALELYDTFVKLAKGEADEVQIDITEMDTELIKYVGDMHSNSGEVGTVVESFIAPVDMEIKGEPVKKGSWLLGVVWNEEHFAKILSGERTGYSLEGKGLYAY